MLASSYLICLIVGGVIVSMSAFAGGHDADADMDVGGDLDLDVGGDLDLDGDIDGGFGDHDFHAEGDLSHDADFDMGIWIPFFSMRFWTFFAAFYGLTGTLLHMFNLAGTITTAVTAGIMGFLCGWIAATSVKLLQKSSVTSIRHKSSYKGRIGKVLVGAEPGQRGRIRISTPGGSVDFSAVMYENLELLHGSYIIIINVKESIAEVMPCPEEALPDPDKNSSIGAPVKKKDVM
jgi:hypothetical protein